MGMDNFARFSLQHDPKTDLCEKTSFPLVWYELSFAKSKEKLKIAFNLLYMKFDRIEKGL